jgi:hypothetical protein
VDGLVSATSFFLARVEVLTQGPVIGLATLGDSITDGTASGIVGATLTPFDGATRDPNEPRAG